MAGWSLGVSYMYAELLGYRYPEWLQGDLNILIGMFWCIVLVDKFTKSNTISCQTVSIISGMSQEAFGRRSTGEVYTYRELLMSYVPFLYCGV